MHALTHGLTSVVFAYVLVLVPMIVALIRRRASLKKLKQSFVLAVPIFLLCALIMNLMTPLLEFLGVARAGVVYLMFGSVLSTVIGYVIGVALSQISESESVHQRGAVVSQIRRRAGPRDSGNPSPLTLAGVPIALEDETKHFKFIGTTGTGKSTAICEILSAALARGDRAVIADPDGGYLQRFYDADRGDVILNPFEPGSVKWDFLGEIATDYDVDQLARSLIPDGSGPDRTWSAYARTFFTALIQQSLKEGIKEDSEIYRLVSKGSVSELRLILEDSAAGPFLEEGNEKMFGSLRSVASSALEALRYTTVQKAPPFSVRKWIRQGAAVHNRGQGGVLFIPYRAGEIAALRTVISAWMRIAIFEAMGQEEGDQRLWFVIDELDALGEIDGLKDALPRLRKFGGRCVLGFQAISQFSSTYGKGTADTLVENCGNTLILRCSASESGGTAQFASRLIGQREVIHFSRSKTRQPTQWVSSTTTSERRTIESAIMASEIEQLPDLEGFLKFASNPDWIRVALTYVNYPTVREKPPRIAVPNSKSAVRSNGASEPTQASKPKRTKPPSAPKRAPKSEGSPPN